MSTFSIQISNQAKVATVTTDNIYIIAKGQKPEETDGQEYFLNFEDSSGIGSFSDRPTVSIDYMQYAKPLSSFKKIDDETYEITVPLIRSCRIFMSINAKLYFILTTDPNTGMVTINEPSMTDPSYPNASILYDKFEMTHLSGEAAFINTTAVDCFGLPLQLSEPEVGKGPLGFIKKRSKVISTLSKSLTGDWTKLYMPNENGSPVIRVLSPAQANTGDYTFPTDYLDSYIDFVWWFYSQPNNNLKIDCSEVKTYINGGGNIFTGTSDGTKFTFTNGVVANDVIVVKPSTMDIWACDGNLDTPNNTIRSVVNKNLAACLNRGLLPSDNVDAITKEWYNTTEVLNSYYQNNAKFASESANTFNHGTYNADKKYYNLYSAALHDDTITAGGLYAFAYDDVGGKDSTLSDAAATYAKVTLNDLSGTTIPNPAPVKDTYKSLFGIPTSDSNDNPQKYNAAYYDNTGAKKTISAGTIYTLPNTFKLNYGKPEEEKDYNININARSYDGLAIGLSMNPDFNKDADVYMGLPPV